MLGGACREALGWIPTLVWLWFHTSFPYRPGEAKLCSKPPPSLSYQGMFQRLDKLHKNGFASVILFGGSNDSTISGIWIFRGQDLSFFVSLDRKSTRLNSSH